MKYYKLLFFILLPLVAWSVLAQTSDYDQMLAEGSKTLANGNPSDAINNYFDPVIKGFESKYQNSDKRIYGVRNPNESLAYMLMAASDEKDAVTISTTWGDAYFLKSFALIELGDIKKAKETIEKGIALSPLNSKYLSELGYLYQLEKNWDMALETFKESEEAATTYTPDEYKNMELSRAKRGIGYMLIELGRLNEAEKKYMECLEIDPQDTKAAAELEYIRKLKGQGNN